MTEEQKQKRREYQRQWIAANPDKKREYGRRAGNKFRSKDRDAWNARCREWRCAHRERAREIGRKANKKFYSLYPDRSREATKKWASKNTTRLKNARKKWKDDNKDKVRLYSQIRRSLKFNAQGVCSLEQLSARIDYYGELCAYCRKVSYRDIDHVIPLTRGGTNWPANLRPACKRCNLSKHNKLLSEWRGAK